MKNSRVCVRPATIRCGERRDLAVEIEPGCSIAPGGGLYYFIDIRQDAGRPQTADSSAPNYLSGASGSGPRLNASAFDGTVRTLDLYPDVPEFLCGGRIDLPDGAASGERIALTVRNWQGPLRPISAFAWFIVVDPEGGLSFDPTGYKSYRVFRTPDGRRVDHEDLARRMSQGSVAVSGDHQPVPPANTRRTPGVLWGELHGMAFNQRPLDDFYTYAKTVSHLDFCAAVLFSYNTCVGNVWQEVKEAAARHTEPGRFVAFAAFECGTPPDDSHRVAVFPNPDAVPPIFCETREPAQDPNLKRRFHPDTVHCRTLDELYDAVHAAGGFVTGHYHTLQYREELLFEIWQKQEFTERYQKTKRSMDEEENLFAYLQAGLKLGVVGGSDTHDSMPGNPFPEPGCPRPAGFTGVHCSELTPTALADAIRARRVFATSGTRMVLDFRCLGAADESPALMGSVLPTSTERAFALKVYGTDNVEWIGVYKNGVLAAEWRPGSRMTSLPYRDAVANGEPAWYLMKVGQRDGHMGWTSPIWFE